MSETDSNHVPNDDLVNEGYEKHDVDVRYIVGFAIVCIFILVTSIIGLDSLFIYTKEKMIREANRVPPAALNALRADSKEKLTTYAVIDKKKGVYQIPIDRAMRIIAGHVETKSNR